MELVPSAGKEEGWEAYLVALPDFLDNPRQTSEELPDLHRLGVSHLDLTVHPVILNEMELKAYILDRPDDDEKYAQFEEALGSAIEQKGCSSSLAHG